MVYSYNKTNKMH